MEVLLAREAERDLEDLYPSVARTASPERAAKLLDGLETACASLADLPERGHLPPELGDLGITEYREINYRRWRVIYHGLGDQVVVYAVLDGHRDVRSALERRLLR